MVTGQWKLQLSRYQEPVSGFVVCILKSWVLSRRISKPPNMEKTSFEEMNDITGRNQPFLSWPSTPRADYIWSDNQFWVIRGKAISERSGSLKVGTNGPQVSAPSQNKEHFQKHIMLSSDFQTADAEEETKISPADEKSICWKNALSAQCWT